MIDILLDDDTGDLVIQDNDLVIVTGSNAIRQNIIQRLRTYFAEWFLDATIGLPYFTQILVKNPDRSKINALIVDTIVGTPGVDTLMQYSSSINAATRELFVDFKCKLQNGDVISVRRNISGFLQTEDGFLVTDDNGNTIQLE